jgi:hypothetical protein
MIDFLNGFSDINLPPAPTPNLPTQNQNLGQSGRHADEDAEQLFLHMAFAFCFLLSA